MNNYCVKVAKSGDLTPSVMRMIYDMGVSFYGSNPHPLFGKWKYFPFKKVADRKDFLILLCYRDEEPVGFLIASRGCAFWNDELRVLRQETLQARPGTRAAYHLMKHFIDIGKASADHVITMIGQRTNIKPSSLKKLGFSELEILYSMEV